MTGRETCEMIIDNDGCKGNRPLCKSCPHDVKKSGCGGYTRSVMLSKQWLEDNKNQPKASS
jgi:hypothetical protein